MIINRTAGDELVFDPFSAIRHLNTPVWVFDVDHGRVAYANDAACAIWRASSEAELQARDLSADMSATVAQRLRQYQRDFIQSNARFSEYWTLYPEGVPTSLKVLYSQFVMPDGRMAMMCEATDALEAEPQTLRSAEALLHTDVMISLYSIDGDALYRNPAARNAVARSDTRFRELFCDELDYRHMESQWCVHDVCRRVALINTVSGQYWHDLTVKRTLDAATGAPALLVTEVDVSEMKIARDKASYLADRDQLTGCFNRSFITQQIERISSDLRHSDHRCAVLFLDIDNFKHINDRFGHEIGDFSLRVFSQRLQSKIRQSDIMARMGGDEFIVLMEDVRNINAVHERLNAIQTEVARPIEHGPIRFNITVSIGVSLIGAETALNWTEIIKQADIALYCAKREGRSRHIFFSDALGAEVADQNWLEAELKKAVDAQAFTLNFQPRVDMRSGRVVSAEALLRWNHPQRGMIPPDQFIPISEKSGLIHDLGAFVMRRSRAQLKKWRDQGLQLDLSLNVSPIQFQNPDLIALYSAIADDDRMIIDGLELEITESSFFGDDADLSNRIRQITDLGFRIALDDFGTGYSNLAYISRFPLSCIKLDKSFVQKLPESGPLLLLILTLARQIGATTVAEGVETSAQFDWLTTHGCDQIQGYLFSPAVTAEEFPARIAAVEEQARRLLKRDSL